MTSPSRAILRRLIGPLALLLGLVFFLGIGEHAPVTASDLPALAGRAVDFQEQPVHRARVLLFLNGEEEPSAEVETQKDGGFIMDLPAGPIQTIRLEIRHPHFYPAVWETADVNLEEGAAIRVPDLVLQRRLTPGFWVATLIFVGMLILIATERLHSTMAALLGVALLLGISLVGRPLDEGLFIFDFEQAIEYVDFNVVFLVLGMMIVIGVVEETGIFQWLAYHAYRLSGGRAWLLVTFLMLLTSVASALLDNVTTMLMVAPITLQIALAMGLDPLTLLIPEVLASNVGGISTLVGTPTNILIGSFAGIGFNDFLNYLTPGVLMAQLGLTIYVLLVYRKAYRSTGSGPSDALRAQLQKSSRISRPDRVYKAGGVFVGIILLFVLGERIHLVPAVTAILGAVAMLLVVRADIQEMLRVVDWTTVMFFITLFIVVGAIREVGLISYIAAGFSWLTHAIASGLHSIWGNASLGTIELWVGVLLIVWGGAFLSGLIANIPFTAAMLPVVGFMTNRLPGAENKVLFYGLSIGAAMGGNSSLIGASANIVTAGISERAGYPLSYMRFVKVGIPAMLITVALGTIWLFIRF